jgi:hypothetical protein
MLTRALPTILLLISSWSFSAEPVSFSREVLPLLSDNCLSPAMGRTKAIARPICGSTRKKEHVTVLKVG